MIRLYQSQHLQPNLHIEVDSKRSHYLLHVLRVKKGDPLVVFNGEGGEYQGEVSYTSKHVVGVQILEFIDRSVESPLRITLAQGIARGEKMDFIVQKAVELGVQTIVPLFTTRSNVRLNAELAQKRQAHWQAIAVSACEQSGRNIVPNVTLPMAWQVWLRFKQWDRAYIFTPTAPASLETEKLIATAEVSLTLGPEGGFTPEEVNEAIEQHFVPRQLGTRILRTETATISAVTLLQFCHGDLG